MRNQAIFNKLSKLNVEAVETVEKSLCSKEVKEIGQDKLSTYLRKSVVELVEKKWLLNLISTSSTGFQYRFCGIVGNIISHTINDLCNFPRHPQIPQSKITKQEVI